MACVSNMADANPSAARARLSNSSLAQLPAGIDRPTYDRAGLTPGIVHIGVGNFHRAHQAWYLHRLMQLGQAHDWAIIGAGVRAADAAMRDRLLAQDCLSTVIELDPASERAEVVGSMIDFLPVQDDNRALIECLSRAEIRIVALTVTEGGYYVDPASGRFDPEHADIQFDCQNPSTPRTAFGAIVAALRIRRDTGVGPLTAQSCDNLQVNGDVFKQTLVGLARLSDPALADWIDSKCSFPNSMVDCSVPATGAHELELVKGLGIDDAAPVTHENFRQWVIEDNFCAGRPDWDQVGAEFTDQVHDFEVMKIRILNGGHQVISVPGELLSVASISGCMRDPDISRLFVKIAQDEVAPHVKAVPNMTPDRYIGLIESRFSNPKIVDTTRRVAFDGSSRHPGFILPSIRDGIARGNSVRGLALVEAAWARMCAGTREDGSKIEPNDPNWDHLQALALQAKADPMVWLGMENIYGELAQAPEFSDAFAHWLGVIWRDGTRAAIQAYCA